MPRAIWRSSGFPFTSGFYSKDHIIEVAFERGAVVGGLALLGAGITGFYMTRLMLMTFYGAKRWQQGVHPHESPPVMTVPLVFLGIGSVFGGLVLNNWIVGWLDPAVGGGGPEETPSLLHFSTVALASLVVVAIGVGISVWIFGPRREIPVTQPASRSLFTLAGRNDLYGDTFNEAVFMRPGQQLTSGLVRLGERRNRRHRQQHGRGHWRDVVPTPSRAERFRPLLRAHHDVGGCDCAASSSCWAGWARGRT